MITVTGLIVTIFLVSSGVISRQSMGSSGPVHFIYEDGQSSFLENQTVLEDVYSTAESVCNLHRICANGDKIHVLAGDQGGEVLLREALQNFFLNSILKCLIVVKYIQYKFYYLNHFKLT